MGSLGLLWMVLAVLWAAPGVLAGAALLGGRKINALPWLVESKGGWVIIYMALSLGLVIFNDQVGNEVLFRIVLTGFLAPMIGWAIVTRFASRPFG